MSLGIDSRISLSLNPGYTQRRPVAPPLPICQYCGLPRNQPRGCCSFRAAATPEGIAWGPLSSYDHRRHYSLPVATFLGLAVEPFRQAVAAATFLAPSFRRHWRGLGRGGIAFEAERLEPLGLGAQGHGFDFVIRCRPLGGLSALQLGKLYIRLVPFGVVIHFAVLQRIVAKM